MNRASPSAIMLVMSPIIQKDFWIVTKTSYLLMLLVFVWIAMYLLCIKCLLKRYAHYPSNSIPNGFHWINLLKQPITVWNLPGVFLSEIPSFNAISFLSKRVLVKVNPISLYVYVIICFQFQMCFECYTNRFNFLLYIPVIFFYAMNHSCLSQPCKSNIISVH